MTLKEIINTEKNKTAFICGLGPSLSESIDYITENRDKIILISCNDIDITTNLIPNYWVFANSLQTFPTMIERFKKNKNTTIIHSDSVDPTPKEWIKLNNEDLKYVGYDQRHFNGEKCNNCPNKCGNFVEGRLTIQEELKNFTNYDKLYSPGDTVAIHMLSLAILLGCKKIYITGVDLDYKKGYYNSYMRPHLVTEFDNCLDNILNDFKIINESAKNNGVEIINTSKDSILKTIFKTEKI